MVLHKNALHYSSGPAWGVAALIAAQIYSLMRLSRNALVTTDTELIAIAAPANIGESSSPKAG